MYTFQSRIRYSEVGVDGNLTLESLLDYFQDSSTFHSEDLGLGIDYLKERHLAWVLSAWQIVVKRYPHLNERVIVGTAPYDFKGFMGSRNFWMDTEAGERLAYANSIWTLMDISKMMPTKPTPDMLEKYVLAEKLDMDYAPRKIAVPDNGTEQEEILVRPHHLDTNGHVNNGQYVRMAMDYVPKEFQISQLRTEYKKQAVLNNRIIPVVAVNETGSIYTVCLNGEDGKPYSIIELEGGRG
ncbi:MAG: acyl-[acyl-carrier-protein] thioesterase [Lachnospiraceae bacterium]|nr:acyl-[acyl-carrier-protein] thioesterase [Lachnospiraceae bacterium]